MKWQVNLVGVDLSIAQNYLKVNNLLGNWDDYKDVLVENLNGEDKTGNISAIIALPGFMFTHEKAGSFSLNFTGRAYATLSGIEERFLSSLYNEANTPGGWETPWKDENVEAGMNAIAEASIGYARNVMDKDRHQLYAGATFKFLTKQIGGNVNGTAEFIYDDSGPQDLLSFGSTDLNLQVSDVFDQIGGDGSSYSTGFGGFGVGFLVDGGR